MMIVLDRLIFGHCQDKRDFYCKNVLIICDFLKLWVVSPVEMFIVTLRIMEIVLPP